MKSTLRWEMTQKRRREFQESALNLSISLKYYSWETAIHFYLLRKHVTGRLSYHTGYRGATWRKVAKDRDTMYHRNSSYLFGIFRDAISHDFILKYKNLLVVVNCWLSNNRYFPGFMWKSHFLVWTFKRFTLASASVFW